MRLSRIIPPLVALFVAALLAAITATVSVNVIEQRSQADVQRVLVLNNHDWASVDTDGLQIILSGSAPDEASRFKALKAAATVLDSSRVVDMMDVALRQPVQPPRFSIEILRNDAGISLIGLIPAEMDREKIVDDIARIAEGANVTDLLDIADYPTPSGWEDAVRYSLQALADLPRAKISVAPDLVTIQAISNSNAEKTKLEASLARRAPDGLPVGLEITAPRPVISPYTLRFILDETGARFDACTTDTTEGRDRILAAARAVGLEGKVSCTIGLGIPSPRWDDAVVAAISALPDLGGGSVTFSDADVTIVALQSTPRGTFEQVIGTLENDLPEIFSLHAILPEPPKSDTDGEGEGPPEFVATRSPEGLVQIRGRVGNERTRIATQTFARAQFGSKAVSGSVLLDDALPEGWSARVLASLEALSYLNHGSVVTQPDIVDVQGTTGIQDARAEITRILSEKLGENENFQINVKYEERLDPEANIPTPQECVDQINTVLKLRQITFAPSSLEIDDASRESVDKIAEIMKQCGDVPMEIGGHTDSQGRESMNLALSQGRAQAVLNALLARRVLTSNLTATGYGETEPVADNGTEAGREQNRRIEFRLLGDETTAPTEIQEPTGSDASGADAPQPQNDQPPQDAPTPTEVPDEQN